MLQFLQQRSANLSPNCHYSILLDHYCHFSIDITILTLKHCQFHNIHHFSYDGQLDWSQAGQAKDVMYGWCCKCREKRPEEYKGLVGWDDHDGDEVNREVIRWSPGTCWVRTCSKLSSNLFCIKKYLKFVKLIHEIPVDFNLPPGTSARTVGGPLKTIIQSERFALHFSCFLLASFHAVFWRCWCGLYCYLVKISMLVMLITTWENIMEREEGMLLAVLRSVSWFQLFWT